MDLLITGVRVLDATVTDARPPPTNILIRGGEIAAIGADVGADGIETFDGRGHLAVPGFVNAHYHSHDVLLRGRYEQLPLEAWMIWTNPAVYPRRPDEEVWLRTMLGASEALRTGITTVQDMVSIVGHDAAHADRLLAAYGQIGIRAVVGMQIGDLAMADTLPWGHEAPADALALMHGAGDPLPMTRFAESLLHHGTDLLSWALAPMGPQRVSDTILAWAGRLSAERGLPVFTHTYETRTQAVVARLNFPQDQGSLIRRLERHGLLGPRLTLAHGVWIDPEEIKQLGAAGANVATNAMSNLKLLNGVAPLRAYARVGVNLAIGCDGCSCSDVQNMFQGMKAFAQFWALQGDVGETGAARAALAAATVGGARALGLEGKVGLLKPGYRADLSLIDLSDPSWCPFNDALLQLVYGEAGRGVRHVIVDGRVVVRDRVLLTADEAGLAEQAEAARAAFEPHVRALAQTNARLTPALLDIFRRAGAYPLPFDRLRLR